MFDGQSFLAFASEKILSPSNGVPKKLLTGSTTGQRTRTKNAVAAPLIGKPKLSNVLRVQRLPQPSVQSRPRRRRLPRPSHGLVWLRVAAPTQPLSPGRPHPQTTSLGASQQPCVSTKSDVICGLSIGLVCSGGTAHPPLTQPSPQQKSTKAVWAQQHPQQHPRSIPTRPHTPSQTTSTAVSWPHLRRQPRLPPPFPPPATSSAATRPKPSLRTTMTGPRSPPFCG